MHWSLCCTRRKKILYPSFSIFCFYQSYTPHALYPIWSVSQTSSLHAYKIFPILTTSSTTTTRRKKIRKSIYQNLDMYREKSAMPSYMANNKNIDKFGRQREPFIGIDTTGAGPIQFLFQCVIHCIITSFLVDSLSPFRSMFLSYISVSAALLNPPPHTPPKRVIIDYICITTLVFFSK